MSGDVFCPFSTRISASFCLPPNACRGERCGARGRTAPDSFNLSLTDPCRICFAALRRRGSSMPTAHSAASACLLVCGGLSGGAGALAIRIAEQPGGWGQCGGGLLRHEPPSHPRTQRMKIGFRITTAARKTSSAQGATIAAETAAPRGCWRHDPRSGARAKPKTERRTGSEIAEIRSDSVSSRQNRWAAMRRRASG